MRRVHALVTAAAVATIAVACRSVESPAPTRVAATIDPQRAARDCVKLASCAHPHDAPRDRDPSACMDAWAAAPPGEDGSFGACVTAARGCAEVDACIHARGDGAAKAYCSANPGTRTGCDGTRSVVCSEDDPTESVATDCAAIGATCGEIKQAGGLLAHACVSPALCPAGAPEQRCATVSGQDGIVACRDGAVERTPCLGASHCEERRGADGAPTAFCELPAHAHCPAVGQRWCQGSALVRCQAHGPYGEAVTTDCSAIGLTCAEDGDVATNGERSAGCVVAGARTCEGGERSAARCDGGALTFCAVGRRFRVECADVGLGGCDPDAHGVDAACAVPERVASGSVGRAALQPAPRP